MRPFGGSCLRIEGGRDLPWSKRDRDDRWSHGGGDHIYIDGDTTQPSLIYGIGGEDFAHHAWGLYPGQGPYTGAQMVHPLPGVKRLEGGTGFEPHGWEQHDGGRYSMYRFFAPDRTCFSQSLRMTFGTAANEISAVTFWYQGEPHQRFVRLPSVQSRGFGVRVTAEEDLMPLPIPGDIPAAVLGIFSPEEVKRHDAAKIQETADPLDSGVTTPFAHLSQPPFRAEWWGTGFRAGFLELASIFRPKIRLRDRGLWNCRSLPVPTFAYVRLRFRTDQSGEFRLSLGFEDESLAWVDGREVFSGNVRQPECWEVREAVFRVDPGEHTLLIRLSQERRARWSSWALFLRLDPVGEGGDSPVWMEQLNLPESPTRFVEPEPSDSMMGDPHFRDPLYLV